MTSRRQFLHLGVRSGIALGLGAALPGVTLAAAGSGPARLVVVILRGALDGLSAVPPIGDPDYARARGAIAIPPPGAAHGALALDGFFGLHPALPWFEARYRGGELLVVHATATAYRDRSHFDGQNVLENGGDRPDANASGWLNRALGALPQRATLGLALGQNVPLLLRGAAPVGSWAPSALPEVDPEFLTRLRELYVEDPALAARLDEATRVDALAADEGGAMGSRRPGAASAGAARLTATAQTAGRMLAAPDGPRVAVMDAGGWDTHAGEGSAEGRLAGRLRILDDTLAALQDGLGSTWASTAVLICTEFGRTVEVNGTGGTDHGTGAAAFLVGGAVRGGRVHADWPGLGVHQRHEGRDLRPTTDLRAVAKGLLTDHLGVSARALAGVFPGSEHIAPLRDLIRV